MFAHCRSTPNASHCHADVHCNHLSCVQEVFLQSEAGGNVAEPEVEPAPPGLKIHVQIAASLALSSILLVGLQGLSWRRLWLMPRTWRSTNTLCHHLVTWSLPVSVEWKWSGGSLVRVPYAESQLITTHQHFLDQ